MDKAAFSGKLNTLLAPHAAKGAKGASGLLSRVTSIVDSYEKSAGATAINWAGLLAFIEQIIALFASPAPAPAPAPNPAP